MPHSQITIEQYADLCEQGTVYDRIDAGGLLTTVGHHPERGAFTAVQSIEGFDLIAEYDAFDPRIPLDDELVAMAMRTLNEIGRRMAGSATA